MALSGRNISQGGRIYASAAVVLLVFAVGREAEGYCTPSNATCWPSAEQWDALSASLGDGKLTLVEESHYSDTCEGLPTSSESAWKLVSEGNGICMQHHNCARQECLVGDTWDLPAYTVRAETAADVTAALEFANEHDISVSVKTTGHSYSGSSTLGGSLLIWMYNFEKYGDVAPHTDTCGTVTPDTLKVGGGQVWYEAYSAVAGKYNIVGGGGKTVGAAGGWLMGGGLSALSRNLGLGIDNVAQFEVVLANGTAAVVDACSHPDLFWALRGGGGGSFAIVTAVNYVVHPVTEVIDMYIGIDLSNPTDPDAGGALIAFYHKWVDVTNEGLDRRWGGYWQFWPGFGIMMFQGNEAEARLTLIEPMEAWKETLPEAQKDLVSFTVVVHEDGYAANSASTVMTDPGSVQDMDIGSRLIPASFVEKNGGDDAKKLLTDLAFSDQAFFTAYHLGGKVAEVAGNESAINPVMRVAAWSMISSRSTVKTLRDRVPGSVPCYNHHQRDEPGDWAEAFWGPNLPRLESIKAQYDPSNRLNCYHCVGYKPLGTTSTSEGTSVFGPYSRLLKAVAYSFGAAVILTLVSF